MATYEIQGPDGKVYQIDGPKGATKEQVVAAIQDRLRERKEEEERKAEEKKPEPESGAIAGFRSSLERMQADYYAVQAARGVEGAEEEAKKHRERAAEIYKSPEFLEHPIDYLTGLVGQSAPYMAAPVVAGLAATAAAPALGLGALGATVLGTSAAFGAGATQFAGSNLSRQLEEGRAAKDLEVGKAVAAAIPQAALDTLSLRMMPGLGRIFEKAGIEVGERQLEEIAKQAIIKRVIVTSGTEGLTESAQQVFERAQAGLNLTDEQARQEYFDSFIGGALLGGVVGVPGAAYEKMKAEDTLKAKEYEAGLAAKKAEEEATKIDKTAVPDAEGNVDLPTFTPSALQTGAKAGTEAAAIDPNNIDAINDALNEARKADAEVGITKEEIQAAQPAVTTGLTDSVIERAYAENDVSTAKVQKALKSELEAMGLTTPADQKAFLKQKQAELGIPTIDPKADGKTKAEQKKQKDIWATNTLSGIKDTIDGEQSINADLTGDQSGAAGAVSESGITPGGTTTSDASGVVPTGGTAKPATTSTPDERTTLKQSEITYNDGNTYVGATLNGIPEGQGTYTQTDGSNYAGEFKGGQFNGQGTYTFADGYTLTGVFENGKLLNGQGTYTSEDGRTLTSIFENGELISKEEPSVTETTETEQTEEEGQKQAATPAKRVIKLGEEKAAPTETHTPEQAAYLGMKTDTRAAPAASIKEGMGYAAAETAFDFYDSAYSNIERALKGRVAEENTARNTAYNEAKARGEKVSKPEKATTLDILQKMPEAELIKLFNENVSEKKLNDTRRNEMKTRAKFIESLTKEQQEAVRKRAVEMFHREVKAVKNIGRTTTQADLRKNREQAARESVEKQLDEIEKPSRKVTPTKEKTGPTQVETLEQKRNAAIQKALESGEVDRVFAAIANERINDSITALFARKIHDVLKTLGLSKTKKSIESKLTAWEKHNGKNYEAARKDVAAAEKYRNQNPEKDVPKNLLDAEKAAKAVIKEYEAQREKLIASLPEGTTQYPTIVLGTVENGHAGKYDPSTDTITIDLNNLGKDRLDIVVLHEITHYMADHVVDNRGNLTKEQQIAINRLDNLYKYVNSKLGKKFDIGNLKEFIAQAFSNPEFQTAMGKLAPMETEGKKQNVFSIFAKRIMEMLGFRNRLLNNEELAEVGGTYGAVLGDVLTQIEQIIKVDRTAPAVGVSYMSSTTPAKKPSKPPIPAPAGGSEKFEELRDSIPSPSFNAKNIVKAFSINKFAEKATRLFQNDRAAIKNWQRRIWLTGRYSSFALGFNNIYDQLTLSSGNADWLYRQYIQKFNEDIRASVADYAKTRDLDVDTALKELGLFAIANHEAERREALYLRTIDLTDAEILTDNKGNPISPNEARNAIFAYMDKHKLELSGAKYLRAQLEAIVNDKKNFSTDPSVDPKSFDRTDRKYNVAGYSTEQIESAKKAYEKYKKDADKVLSKLKAVNEATLELNTMANYMSEFANNYIMFYGFENYVPFKGKNFSEDKADMFNTDGRKLGGDFQEDQHTFEGRITVPENPILQVMADGAKAAMRAGRKDVTQSIYNAVKDGTLDGEIMKFGDKDYVEFEDRKNDDILKQLKGETKIFHYMPNGRVAIIQINNREQREAIRRTYQTTNPVADYALNVLNTYTGLAGQMHTRYKIGFAPMNFVRDVLTNAWSIGAEGKGWLGPLQSFRYLGAVGLDVATGKLFKSWRFAALYSQGKTGVIEQLAKNDSYYKDLLDYTKTGGKVSYIQGIAPKGQLQEVMKSPQGKLFDKDKIDRLFDIWIDTFEMASRVSAFRIAKATITTDLKKKGGATKEEIDEASTKTAAAYAKNLANFEQVGEWGRAIGALFVFFRPSATGAVRAMDAVAPAFNFSMDRAKLALPEFAAIANIKEKLSKSPTATEEKELKAELVKMEKAVKTFEENYAQLKVSSRIVVAALAGAGVAVYWMAQSTGDDDELGRNRVSTDDMTRWTKFARFHIPGFENPIQLPWGFGLGAFAAMGAQLAAMSDPKNPTNKIDLMGNMVMITLDSFMPLPFSRIPITEKPGQMLLDSITPSLIRPISEFYMNVDALGHQIYNNRQTKFGDAYTGGDNIPESYKAAARLLAESTNGALNWSPNTMYFFANNYVDGVANVVNSGINIALWLSGKKDFNSHTDTMVFDSFFGSRSNFDSRQWSKVEEDLKNRSEKVKMFKADPVMYAKYLSANPLDAVLQREYDGDVQGRLKELRAEANKWRTMRSLDIKTRTALVKNAVLQENMIKYHLIQKYKALGIEL